MAADSTDRDRVIHAAQAMREQARASREHSRRMADDDRALRIRVRARRAASTDRRPSDPASPSTTLLHIESETVPPSGVLLRVTGELTPAAAATLGEALQFRVQAALLDTKLIVDMTNVSSIGTHGFAVLQRTAAEAHDADVAFHLIGRSLCPTRLMDITGTS